MHSGWIPYSGWPRSHWLISSAIQRTSGINAWRVFPCGSDATRGCGGCTGWFGGWIGCKGYWYKGWIVVTDDGNVYISDIKPAGIICWYWFDIVGIVVKALCDTPVLTIDVDIGCAVSCVVDVFIITVGRTLLFDDGCCVTWCKVCISCCSCRSCSSCFISRSFSFCWCFSLCFLS